MTRLGGVDLGRLDGLGLCNRGKERRGFAGDGN